MNNSKTPVLYSWTINRSGAAVTVHHSHGKVTNITKVTLDAGGKIIAIAKSGLVYELSLEESDSLG